MHISYNTNNKEIHEALFNELRDVKQDLRSIGAGVLPK
jgi:hypothetical protein